MSSSAEEMFVTKRNGKREEIGFDKILKRVKQIGKEANVQINISLLVMKIIDQLYDGIETAIIDELTAQQCASQITIHPDYGKMASRIIISNHHKNTTNSFSEKMNKLYNFTDIHGKHCPMIREDIINYINENKEAIEQTIDYERDYLFDYFGFKTLEKSYLFNIHGKIIERPQDLWMRVSLCIHSSNLEKAFETYNLMSQKYFTHATPTLYNACTLRQQMSSCYLLAMEDDSIDGIYNTLKDCARISKHAGGIGLHIHNIRGSGTHIRGTNGISNGIVPMLRVFNNTARYVDQCVIPDTYIYTDKGPVKIENVVSNETQIINEKGEMEVIENVLEHSYDGSMITIKTMHSLEPLTITQEHPILVLSGQQRGLNYNTIKKRLENKTIDIEWKDGKDISKDDMLVYSIPKYEKDISNLSEDDCYMYGILLGDGCINNNYDYGYISLHSVNKRPIIEFCERYFYNKCVEYKTDTNENTTRVRWTKNIVLPFRYAEMYTSEKEKYIHNKWLHLPIHKIQYIVKGLIDTDGCKHNELVFDNTSRILIEGLRYLLLRMGIPTSGYIRDRVGQEHMTKRGIIANKKISYCLRIPKTNIIKKLMNMDYDDDNQTFYKFFTHNNYIFTRIKEINEINYTGTLYDLQMKDVHSYTIHNGVIHNGGGRRNGSFAIYLEPWHHDIRHFLEMRKNQGDEEMKARDLFYALWIPDLFMKRVHENKEWTLMCPDKCPGLSDVYGEEFEELYTKYESENRGETISARELWFSILDSQMETGTPYLLYKDSCNKKSNQKNLGTIKSSNLCTEIIEYSDSTETAVCNLASISLAAFVKNKEFDFKKLEDVVGVVTNNLNNIIDINYYPTDKTRKSNMRHRPIGIGVQGLADCFILMDIAFHSNQAKELNKKIFETMYYSALKKSNEIAKERYELIQQKYMNKPGIDKTVYDMFNDYEQNILELMRNKKTYAGAYSTFENSPAHNGLLQYDMWDATPSDRYNWKELKDNIIKYGIRNSLLTAPMPTASTAQILGNNECFEPLTSNIYSRRTLAGEFIIVNKYLMNDLLKINMWNEQIKNNIIENKGSIQQIVNIPQNIKDKYKIVWEIPMKHIIDMAADRGAYICQSQSMNLWLEEPTYNNLTSMHFYGWKKGLKTGMYYLRRKAKHQAQQFTIDPGTVNNDENNENNEICEMCSG
jgi:ribonucleotide reductase alpha subunit